MLRITYRMLVAGLTLVLATAQAQNYPSRTVRIVVPNAAGGPSDIVGRILAQKFAESWNVPVVVDNRAGAGGNIGADAVAKAAPDGYTLLVTNSAPIAVNRSLYSKMPFDPLKDLAPISLIASAPLVLAVPPNSSFNSVADVIRAAKAKPGELTFATLGSGTAPHLAAEMFKAQAGVDALHVPYRTVPLAVAAVMNGEVSMIFLTTDGSLPQVKAGRIKGLAVTSQQRSSLAPSLPALTESGLPEFEVLGWYGILAPTGTSPEIVSRIHAETTRVLALPDVKQRMNAIGFEVAGNSPEQFTSYIAVESARWGKLLKAAGVRVE